MRNARRDLGKGITMNAALAAHMAPLEDLDDDFLEYAQTKAENFGGAYAYKAPEGILEVALDAVVSKPNYFDILKEAEQNLDEKKWEEAKTILEEVIDNSDYLPGDENAHIRLARAYRGLEDTSREIEMLQLITEMESDRLEATSRLLTLAIEENDWSSAKRWAQATLAINPMSRLPWQALFDAEEELDQPREAIKAGNVLVELEVPNIAETHYRLSRIHFSQRTLSQAKRHILLALESAPRYREAFELLKEIQAEENKSASPEKRPESLLDLSFPEIE